VERAVSRRHFIILDSLNNIKGYRCVTVQTLVQKTMHAAASLSCSTVAAFTEEDVSYGDNIN